MERPDPPYTCATYRSEMLLLGLLRRLKDESLSDSEKEKLLQKVRQLESETGLEA